MDERLFWQHKFLQIHSKFLFFHIFHKFSIAQKSTKNSVLHQSANSNRTRKYSRTVTFILSCLIQERTQNKPSSCVFTTSDFKFSTFFSLLSFFCFFSVCCSCYMRFISLCCAVVVLFVAGEQRAHHTKSDDFRPTRCRLCRKIFSADFVVLLLFVFFHRVHHQWADSELRNQQGKVGNFFYCVIHNSMKNEDVNVALHRAHWCSFSLSVTTRRWFSLLKKCTLWYTEDATRPAEYQTSQEKSENVFKIHSH